MTLSGNNSGNGFEYSVTVFTTVSKAKRDGRNPSTGAFTSGQSSRIVRDNYAVNVLGHVETLDVDNYSPAIPEDEID